MASHFAFLNQRQRREAGATVTFENGDGLTITGQRRGNVDDAVSALCDAALALDPSYRIVSIATPTTIVRDVRGPTRGRQIPERGMLTRIGRSAMLHPRLR